MTDRAQPLTAVVVLNWNGRAHLETCLSSILGQSHPRTAAYLVDNGSTDGSVGFVRERFSRVRVIAFPENTGFCAGNNAGMRAALREGADYILLLNNDTEIDPGCVAALVREAETDPLIGACGCRMLFFHERTLINSTGVEASIYGQCWDRGKGRFSGGRWLEACDILAACGGALFLRASALRETGLLCERFFTYFEDVDLCIRLRGKGFGVRYVPEAVVFHKLGATAELPVYTPRKMFFVQRNRFLLVLRNCPARLLPSVIIANAAFELRRARAHLRLRDADALLVQARAVISILFLLPAIALHRLRTRRDARGRAWSMLHTHPDACPDLLPDPPSPPGEELSNRVVMGAREGGRGKGWYGPMEADGTRFRWMGARATVTLLLPPGEAWLALVIADPYPDAPRKECLVYGAGALLGRLTPDRSFRRHELAFHGRPGAVEIVLEASGLIDGFALGEPADFSFRVSEIGFL